MMSRAFVKEDEGQKWEAPAQARQYRVLWAGSGNADILREGNDLLELLRWVAARPHGQFEVRGQDGTLLATVAEVA